MSTKFILTHGAHGEDDRRLALKAPFDLVAC